MAKYTEAEKKRHVEAWTRSGQSARAYAQRNGMSYPTLLHWQSSQRESALVVNAAARPRSCEPARFVELVLEDDETRNEVARGSAIEIVTRRGARVRVVDGFGEQTLRRVLDVLGGA